MKTAIIPRVSQTPDWDAIPLLPIDTLLWSEPVDISAWAQICWNNRALYVRLSAREAQIRAEHTGPIGMPCQDSCLEFFFSPVPGDNRYLNFEFNPNCCLYLGIGSGGHDLVRLLPGDTAIFHPQVLRTADGWNLTYEIPVSFIRRFFPQFTPAPGGTIRANFYKCGDLTPQPHFLAWNPVGCETPNFHCPEWFGQLTFE